MKKMIFAAAIVCLGFTAVFAQDSKVPKAATTSDAKGGMKMDPSKKAEMRAERIAKKLELNEDQKNKITAILKDGEQDKSNPAESRKEAAIRKDAKIKAVLNQEQLAKWNQLKAQQMEARKARKAEMQQNADSAED